MSKEIESDPALCARSARGDQRAFGELVRRHEHQLRAFLRRVAGAELGDELAQETFIKAWQSAGQFRGQAAFLTWLCAIGWRCFADHLRRQRQEVRKGEELAATAPSAETSSPDQRLDLSRVLLALSPEERASLVLCDGYGWSHAEAALILQMPLGTLKGTVMRAKKKCRTALEAGGK